MLRSESFFFAWEGASAPEGPWRHLLVLAAEGEEALSEAYRYELDLVRAEGAPPVDFTELLGARASLWIRTRTEPGRRLVHGVIGEVEEVDVDDGRERLRVVLVPPYARAGMMKKSLVYVDKTLRQILDATLTRSVLGMGLTESTLDDREDDAAHALTDLPPASYEPFRAEYTWRCTAQQRLSHVEGRPYCVQYDEDDVTFVARLLEEEGIAYHFVHTTDACTLVLSDRDGSMRWRADSLHVGARLVNREVTELRLGSRLRPRAVVLDDVDWRKPDLELLAFSPGRATPQGEAFTTIEQPGRYGHDAALGQALAEVREQRLDTERTFASFKTRARGLGAGTVFTLDHDRARLGGAYLALRTKIELVQRASFGDVQDEPSYVAQVDAVRVGEPGGVSFRPERVTRRPRVRGSQTATVTAEPGQEQEINVGGPGDLGCVRVRFAWDQESRRHAVEPTSCWVRVSQTFAGGKGHGALFHPRVGDEVVVDFLDGDPDRPLVTGRVYNGRNLAPENATHRPTYSCIRSMTSPFDGNFNMIAFDDLQGEEKFIIHVAKDYIADIEHDASETIRNLHDVTVHGDQTVVLKQNQTTSIGIDWTTNVTGDTRLKTNDYFVKVGPQMLVDVGGLHFSMASVFNIKGHTSVTLSAPSILIKAGATNTLTGPVITLAGGEIAIGADGSTLVRGGSAVEVISDVVVNISAPTVNINGTGTVNVKGGAINLNC